MTIKKSAVFLLQLTVSATLLWFAFRNMDFEQLWRVFASLDPMWILLGVVFFICGLGVRIRRWKRMIGQSNPEITFHECAKPFLASACMNNFLPFRAGDAVRLFAFNRSLGITSAASMVYLIMERVLDVIVFTAALGVTIVALGLYGSHGFIFTNILVSSLIVSLCLISFVLRPRLFLYPAKWASKMIGAFSGVAAEKWKIFVSSSVESMALLTEQGVTRRLLFDTSLVWILDAALYCAVALSLTSLQHPIAAFLAVSVCALSLIIPSAPAGIGPFEYFGALSVTSLGNDPVSASGFILAIHVVVLVVPVLCFFSCGVFDKKSTRNRISKPL